MKTKKTMKVGFMAMQLDMSKVYDRVEWVWCEPQSTRFETQQTILEYDANLNWLALRPNKNIGILAQES